MEKLIQYATRESFYDGPFNGKVGWHAAGMGYILVTENGKLIVIDGGSPNDTEDFLALLEKNAGGEKPVVALWVITHPHSDHHGVLDRIAKTPEYLARVEIKEILYRGFDGRLYNYETGELAEDWEDAKKDKASPRREK